MVGDQALQSALAAYRPGADKDPSYLQRLLQTSSKHDLEWFFDDWVYRDRGLPDFHVESVYARPLLSEAYKSFLVTATIENRGSAGAEVPVLIQTPSGEKSLRVIGEGWRERHRSHRGARSSRQNHGQRRQRPRIEPRQQRLRRARTRKTLTSRMRCSHGGCTCQ